MKDIYLKVSVLGLLSIFIYSCSSDDAVAIDTTAPLDVIAIFGIRHDKTLADYEAIVSATDDYSNFDTVVLLDLTDAALMISTILQEP
jgi:hypothetical protein